MPVEEVEYGYVAEDRHMVQRFLDGKSPALTFQDGLEVTKLLMACYMSAERGQRVSFPIDGLDDYIPVTARTSERSHG